MFIITNHPLFKHKPVMTKRKSERVCSQSFLPAFKTTTVHEQIEYEYKNQVNQLSQTIDSLRRENASIMSRAESYVVNLKDEFSNRENETRKKTLEGVASLKDIYNKEIDGLRESLSSAKSHIEHQNRMIQFLRVSLANAESRGNNDELDTSVGAF